MGEIVFNKAYTSINEREYVLNSLESRKLAGDNFYTKKCIDYFKTKYQIERLLLTTSCSMALDMSMILAGIKKGDEVIMPSFNFVSGANSVVARGGIPVFAEINPETMNIDIEDIKMKLSDRTKVILPVHYAGVSCEMDEIMEIAQKKSLLVIEDAAQGVNSYYKNRPLGTIGDFGTFSFHETKNYTSGEGGAILIRDRAIFEKAEIVREKGTDRSKFLRGEVDKYTWTEYGSSFLPSDTLMALLYGQLQDNEIIQNRREYIYNFYVSELRSNENIILPKIPDYATSNYHIFYFFVDNLNVRNDLMFYLKSKGIQANSHYIPLHVSPMGKKLGYKKGDLRLTESFSERLIRLPLYPELKEEALTYIVETVKNFFDK